MDAQAPVDSTETVYRRAVPHWIKAGDVLEIATEAFLPHKTEDNNGLSLSREKSIEHPEFLTALEFVALSKKGKSYYAFSLKAEVIQSLGLEIVPDAIRPENLGHALVPALNSLERKRNKPRCLEIAESLARHVAQNPSIILGPYEGQRESPTE